ncbi:MAG: hypothetical protein FWD56_06660, partial [Bacteroidales bacterium]|nr:hypothetical protein [Bacteroidales bacterium]
LTPQGIRLRNILITIQFFTATTLIVGALFIKLQHSYMRNQPIGMERENIVVIEVMNEKEITAHIDAVANQMMENVHVRDYTTSTSKPGFVGMGWGRVFDGKQVQMRVLPVRYNFLRFFNIPVIEGNDFFEHNQRGGSRVIFNKKTVDNFGLVDPIGKELSDDSGLVVGVAANANFASLRQEIEPLAFVCSDNWPTFHLYLKIDAQDTPSTVAHIKNVFSRFSPNEINLSFFDDDINNLYVNEANLANIISLFSLIAIVISLMGVYGLVIFNAKFKVREIGVRKVNGASEMEIILLLNKGFFKIIALAFVIAMPVSWYLVFNWLRNFPYRVSIYWWVFALAGIITIVITLLTVSYQSWKAAVQNPVHSLKAE